MKRATYMKYFIVFILLNLVFFSLPRAGANSPPQEKLLSLERFEQAIWKISSLENDENEKGRVVFNGTGFFVGANHLITNFHIIFHMLKWPENDIVLSQGGNIAFVKRILALSGIHDLALLEVERTPVNSLNLTEEWPKFDMEEEPTSFLSLREDPLKPDENLFLVAYSQGAFTRIRKTEDISYEDRQHYGFSIDKSGLSGASGSPVLDEQGQVVGVTSFGLNNLLYAIKVNHLRKFIAGDTGVRCSDSNGTIDFFAAEACMEKEIKNLTELAEEGSIYAQARLFRMFLSPPHSDFNQAFLWAEKSAAQGYAPAQHTLAVMYSKGDGVNKDTDQAFLWMKRSAEQGYVPAQHKLALMYSEGIGVNKDTDQAFSWLKRSAEQGYAPAQYELAIMYSEGSGVDRDADQASLWMKRSAEQGYVPAQQELSGVDIDAIRDMNQVFQQIFQNKEVIDSWAVPRTSYPEKETIFSGEGLDRGKLILHKYLISPLKKN